jgi:hypothetical protein
MYIVSEQTIRSILNGQKKKNKNSVEFVLKRIGRVRELPGRKARIAALLYHRIGVHSNAGEKVRRTAYIHIRVYGNSARPNVRAEYVRLVGRRPRTNSDSINRVHIK